MFFFYVHAFTSYEVLDENLNLTRERGELWYEVKKSVPPIRLLAPPWPPHSEKAGADTK